MDHQTLARRLKNNDQNAFEEIIRLYTPLMATIAYNIGGGRLNHHDVEEVVNDVFVTLWKNKDVLQPDTLHSYLCCIAKSRTKDRLRTINAPPMMDIDETEEPSDMFIETDYEDQALSEALREEIQHLPEPDREILIRHYYYYQSVTKIASALQMNVSTVKSKMQYARKKLKNALQKRGY